ncbi:MAG: MBL fold metallo-hydrolase [Anaerolineaceae bacterium]|nr:MBL fold metallo-hydrolase [Anaerolineaceae bacterium]
MNNSLSLPPEIFCIPLPLPNNPLGLVNVYLIKTSEGCLLVDTGWNTEESYQALVKGLEKAGVALQDLRILFITHTHPDHFGLASRLQQASQARVMLHTAEGSWIEQQRAFGARFLADGAVWLSQNGFPPDQLAVLKQTLPGLARSQTAPTIDRYLQDGEHLSLGEFDLEAIWTPGHAPGHLCLYDRQRQMLFSGDHVLPNITPNIGFSMKPGSNPLADYLASLEKVAALAARLVLPSHGGAFSDLPGRVRQIEEHHEVRLGLMLAAVQAGDKNAYQVTAAVPWTESAISITELDTVSKFFALAETSAHLELLVSRGRVSKAQPDGTIQYSVRRGG